MININLKNKRSIYIYYTYLAQILNVISAIIIRRYLSPDLMGTFTLLQVIYGYFDLSHLGLRFALDKKLPIIDDENKRKRYFYVSLSYAIIFAFIFYILVVLIFFRIFYNKKILLGLIIVEISSLFFIILNFIKAFYRASENINIMNFFALYYLNFLSIFKIIFLLLWGFWGILTAILAGNILFFIKIKAKTNFNFNFNFNKEIFFKLFSVGFPLFLNSLINLTLLQLDKWIVLFLLGKKMLGYYSVPMLFTSFMWILPNTLSELFFPKIIKSFTKGKRELISYIKKISIILLSLNFIISLFVSIVLPIIIRILLPLYKKTILAAQISVFSVVPLMLYSILYYSLISINKQKSIFIINLIALFISFIILFLFTSFLKTIESIALGMLISRMLQSTIMLIYFMNSLKKIE